MGCWPIVASFYPNLKLFRFELNGSHLFIFYNATAGLSPKSSTWFCSWEVSTSSLRECFITLEDIFLVAQRCSQHFLGVPRVAREATRRSRVRVCAGLSWVWVKVRFKAKIRASVRVKGRGHGSGWVFGPCYAGFEGTQNKQSRAKASREELGQTSRRFKYVSESV